MWHRLYDETWKKAMIIVVAILLSCFAIILWNAHKNEIALKEKTEQSFNQANKITQNNEETFELMYEYVRRHVPYYTTAMSEDELVTKIIRDIILEVQSEHAEEEHAAGEESNYLEDEQLVYLTFQLQEALINEDSDEFMSVFQTNAYADFVYQFDSVDSLENALDELMSKITLDGSFESLTYKRNKRVNNQIDFTLYYFNHSEHTLSLNTVKLEEKHSFNDDVEVFSTKFDDLMKNFK